MKKEKISHRIIGNSGPLMISWTDKPKGDAVEDLSGNGVGFFSKDGDILACEFDDVKSTDHQTLQFENYTVEIHVRNGKVTYKMVHIEKKPVKKKKRRAA